MTTVEPVRAASRVLLRGVSWQTYLALRSAPENANVRMIYEQGNLEIMSPSQFHEALAYLLGRLIDVWTEELNVDVKSCRCTTFQREDMEKGLEPDNCYYVRHEPLVWEKAEIDLAVDPPPDLAIEIDVSGSSLKKLSLYAAFAVPELWRYDGQALQVFQLERERGYVRRDTSFSFPTLPMSQVEATLRQLGAVRETVLVKRFRAWVREFLRSGGLPDASDST